MISLSPYSEGGDTPHAGYRNLWLSVLQLAVADAQGNFISVGGPGHTTVQRMAIKWLISDSYDFRVVCRLAGVSPTWATRKFRECFSLEGMPKYGVKRYRTVRGTTKPRMKEEEDVYGDDEGAAQP